MTSPEIMRLTVTRCRRLKPTPNGNPRHSLTFAGLPGTFHTDPDASYVYAVEGRTADVTISGRRITSFELIEGAAS